MIFIPSRTLLILTIIYFQTLNQINYLQFRLSEVDNIIEKLCFIYINLILFKSILRGNFFLYLGKKLNKKRCYIYLMRNLTLRGFYRKGFNNFPNIIIFPTLFWKNKVLVSYSSIYDKTIFFNFY